MCRVLNKIISILGNVLCAILSIVLIAFLLIPFGTVSFLISDFSILSLFTFSHIIAMSG